MTSSPAQMGSTLKKVMLQCLHVHCKSSLSGRIYMILSLLWGKLEPLLILHRFRQPVLNGFMHNLTVFKMVTMLYAIFQQSRIIENLLHSEMIICQESCHHFLAIAAFLLNITRKILRNIHSMLQSHVNNDRWETMLYCANWHKLGFCCDGRNMFLYNLDRLNHVK